MSFSVFQLFIKSSQVPFGVFLMSFYIFHFFMLFSLIREIRCIYLFWLHIYKQIYKDGEEVTLASVFLVWGLHSLLFQVLVLESSQHSVEKCVNGSTELMVWFEARGYNSRQILPSPAKICLLRSPQLWSWNMVWLWNSCNWIRFIN